MGKTPKLRVISFKNKRGNISIKNKIMTKILKLRI